MIGRNPVRPVNEFSIGRHGSRTFEDQYQAEEGQGAE